MARFLIVEARFYSHLNDMLIAGAKAALEEAGHHADVITVPGALEVPGAIALAAESGRYDGFVAIGVVIPFAAFDNPVAGVIRAAFGFSTALVLSGTLFTLVFALGSVMAGIAGMMIAPITEATIGMGNDIIITAFVVIIVGGIGSMKGAFIAALMIGLIDTLGRSFLDDILKLFVPVNAAETAGPAISSMLIYIIMAAVLAMRPQGLFPPKVR